MQQYKIVLKNEKLRLYNRLSLFIIIIFSLFYIYIAFFNKNSTTNFLKLSVILPIIVFSIVQFFRPEKKRDFFWAQYFFLMLGWVWFQFYWLAALTFLFEILYLYATKQKKAQFSEAEISYPSIPTKKINWLSLANCLLKDGLLTIDFKNNKIIQQLIDETKTSVNEKEFNDFCRQQLNQ